MRFANPSMGSIVIIGGAFGRSEDVGDVILFLAAGR
jgi:hypothetical protein